MADIQITELLETASPELFPTQATDGSGAHYPFALTDEATFNVVLPDGWIEGSPIYLRLYERTAGVSLNHNWQVDAEIGTASVSDTEQFTSSSVAQTLTSRSITITTDGTIDTTVLAPADTIAVTLKRIAASASEDGNPIRVYAVWVNVDVRPNEISGCLGDVGELIDDVLVLANDVDERFVKGWMIIGALNRCTEYLAQRGFFTDETTLTWGSATYLDLITEIPRIERVFEVRRASDNRALPPCSTRGEFNALQVTNSSGQSVADLLDYVPYALIERNKIYIYPVPTSGTQFVVHHSEVPAALACQNNYTLPIPIAHSILYIFWCRAWICMIDRGKPESIDDFKLYWELFHAELKSLTIQDFSAGFKLVT